MLYFKLYREISLKLILEIKYIPKIQAKKIHLYLLTLHIVYLPNKDVLTQAATELKDFLADYRQLD